MSGVTSSPDCMQLEHSVNGAKNCGIADNNLKGLSLLFICIHCAWKNVFPLFCPPLLSPPCVLFILPYKLQSELNFVLCCHFVVFLVSSLAGIWIQIQPFSIHFYRLDVLNFLHVHLIWWLVLYQLTELHRLLLVKAILALVPPTYTVCLKKTGTPIHISTTMWLFALMAYPFCHINCDLFPINCVIFNKIPHTVYEIRMFKKITLLY